MNIAKSGDCIDQIIANFELRVSIEGVSILHPLKRVSYSPPVLLLPRFSTGDDATDTIDVFGRHLDCMPRCLAQ